MKATVLPTVAARAAAIVTRRLPVNVSDTLETAAAVTVTLLVTPPTIWIVGNGVTLTVYAPARMVVKVNVPVALVVVVATGVFVVSVPM